MSSRHSSGPMVTTIGGLVVLLVSAWMVWVKGELDLHAGMLAGSGVVLMLNGGLRWAREVAERKARPSVERVRPKGPRRSLLSRITPVHVLFVLAVLEMGVNRIAVPMTQPTKGTPPAWHTWLDYAGLFLFYFTGVLAALVLALRCADAVREQAAGLRFRIAHAAVALATLIASVPLVVSAPEALSLVLELSFGISVVLVIASVFDREVDTGIQIGLPIIAIPLLVHTANAVGARFFWPDTTFEGPGIAIARAGVLALSIAALVSPYCFAPRPFTRAVTRAAPILIALVVLTVGAVLGRAFYPKLAKAASLAIGVELSQLQADRRLALYLLAIATLAWTLVSCAIAASAARRKVGLGLALVLLGGYGFRWPHHYLLPLLGVVLIADASRRVRDEELAAMPLSSDTPPIPDALWSTYIAAVAQGLRRSLTNVHTLTTRGEGGLTSSIIVGEYDGLSVRARVERVEGSVLALDVVVGREIDELRGATLTVWALAPRALGTNPPGPPAAPPLRSSDPAFDERFRTRGSVHALQRLFDDELRDRAVTSLDGWLAYWDDEGMRYRVYPGKGAPLDHPMPLSDLAQGRVAAEQAERLVAVIELVVEIARRGVTPPSTTAPTTLDDLEVS
ncbi:MAG: hypothetical protein SFX73_32455 [Kofleriaceae bacterium]|nr:hypothetical protein [Kofleriaceae bacterium]